MQRRRTARKKEEESGRRRERQTGWSRAEPLTRLRCSERRNRAGAEGKATPETLVRFTLSGVEREENWRDGANELERCEIIDDMNIPFFFLSLLFCDSFLLSASSRLLLQEVSWRAAL